MLVLVLSFRLCLYWVVEKTLGGGPHDGRSSSAGKGIGGRPVRNPALGLQDLAAETGQTRTPVSSSSGTNVYDPPCQGRKPEQSRRQRSCTIPSRTGSRTRLRPSLHGPLKSHTCRGLGSLAPQKFNSLLELHHYCANLTLVSKGHALVHHGIEDVAFRYRIRVIVDIPHKSDGDILVANGCGQACRRWSVGQRHRSTRSTDATLPPTRYRSCANN